MGPGQCLSPRRLCRVLFHFSNSEAISDSWGHIKRTQESTSRGCPSHRGDNLSISEDNNSNGLKHIKHV